MYLPNSLPNAKVLITVKTYPLPSRKYDELVCTAGLLPDKKWIRIYPVPFRWKPFDEQYKKYNWVELNLEHNLKDFRPESYRPRLGFDEPITTVDRIGTQNNWQNRKDFILHDVYESMNELIQHAKGNDKKSLAILRPTEIVDFVIEEDEREWKKEWRDQLRQLSYFDMSPTGEGKERDIVRKLPYKYSYRFLTKGDQRPRKLMIEDWEIGALYWNCLSQTEGNEQAANELVRKKYEEEFLSKRDIYLFLGTTLQYHNVSPNPFVIIGVFYPPKVDFEQPRLL